MTQPQESGDSAKEYSVEAANITKDKRNWFEKYGGNVGGWLYGIACLSEASTFVTTNLVSSGFMGSSIVTAILFGHKNKGFMSYAILNLIGSIAGILIRYVRLSSWA